MTTTKQKQKKDAERMFNSADIMTQIKLTKNVSVSIFG